MAVLPLKLHLKSLNSFPLGRAWAHGLSFPARNVEIKDLGWSATFAASLNALAAKPIAFRLRSG
jgi:hypothetical protein